MQNPKVRSVSVEVPQQMSPSSKTSQKSSPSSNQTSRQIKVARFRPESVDSSNSTSRTPKNNSPKVLGRGSPRSPMTEKKRASKLSDLESQLAQLEDDLKKTKEQLISSETIKRRAFQEGEEMRKHLTIMSARLQESQQQLGEISTSEDTRIKELQKLSQERDRVWQSEVEAIQKQHSMDSAALASSLNEIQKLKRQLEMVSDSKTTNSRHAETAHAEIERLRIELSETVSLVENMRKQVCDCKESEIQAQKVARESQTQLEEAVTIAESLRSDEIKAKEAYNGLALELEKSNEKASSLENLVMELEKKLQRSKRPSGEVTHGAEKEEGTEAIELNAELDAFKLEVGHLKSALEASELRYQEEYIQSTLQIRNAFDQVERTKSEIGAREAELEAELKKARGTIDELRSAQNLSSNKKKLDGILENELNSGKSELEMEINILNGDLQDLRAMLLDKETRLQIITEENKMLKAEIQNKENKERAMSSETAKVAEREAMSKLGYVTEEAENSSMKAAQVAEQLEAAQKGNTELEAELRKLKVQSEQWRKAAEAAAAMLSTGSNAKFVDRTSSFNSISAKMDSTLSDDIDEDSPIKKNGNMLKKFGVLWKKGQK